MSANREQKDYLDSVEYRIMQRAFMEMQMKKDALYRARIALEKAQQGNPVKLVDYQSKDKQTSLGVR